MAYGANPFTRVDKLETIVCEQITNCQELGNELMAEGSFDEADEVSDRMDQLELRLERLAHISAKLSSLNL